VEEEEEIKGIAWGCSPPAENDERRRILGWTAPVVKLGAAGLRDGVGAPVAYKLG
jgi:hypothetical protein